MKIRWVIGAAVLAGVVAIFGPAVAAASTFQNGNFTEGNYSPTYPGFETLVAGQSSATAMTGWTVTTNSVDWIQGLWTSPGGYSVDMNGTSSEQTDQSSAAGAIAQTFTTVSGAMYAVQFELAANQACGPTTKGVFVTATGTPAEEFYSSTQASATTFAATEYPFTATSSATTLTFAADPSNTSNCGAVIADVSVTETSATGALCKDGGWQNLINTTTGAPFNNQGDCVSFYATSGATPIGS